MKELLTHLTIMTMDDAGTILQDGYIAIDGKKIAAIGPMAELDPAGYADYAVTDCHRNLQPLVALPGFIQTHVHTTQALGRGLADDCDLITWTRKRIWPYEAALTPDDVYISAQLSMAEMIKSGTTQFCEASGEHPDAIAQAVIDTGIKGTVSLSTMDLPGEIPETLRMTYDQACQRNFDLVEKWHNNAQCDRVDACLNILNLFLSSEKLWRTFHEYAIRNNVLLQCHAAESISEVEYTLATYGKRSIELLESWGALSPNLLAAHVVHVEPHEIDLLVERGVKCMHCPGADLRIAGFAPIDEYLKRGIPVSLGTNSPPCNNRMSMMDEMWLTGLMHKAIHQDPEAVPARAVLAMATRNGATALQKLDTCGTLEAGKCADITLLNLNTLCSTPTYDLYSTIVYQATSAVVDTVFVNGRKLLDRGRLTTMDEASLIREAQRRGHAIVQRAGIQY